jgi:V/A-type H+-transporting ATPase subunit A
MVRRAEHLLRQGNEIGKRMEVVGEEGTSLEDMVTYLKAELYDFCYLQQNAFDKEDAYCPLRRQIALFLLINAVFDKSFHFEGHDKAREYFLSLQNQIKNLNFMSFESHQYREAMNNIHVELTS